jgi:hypothetical protein
LNVVSTFVIVSSPGNGGDETGRNPPSTLIAVSGSNPQLTMAAAIGLVL